MREEDFYAHQSYGERAADNLARCMFLKRSVTHTAVSVRRPVA
jgi:hypothetical protein